MKILILKSIRNETGRDPYSLTIDTEFALKTIDHLSGGEDICSSCGRKCINCRENYHLNFKSNIAGIINFPATIPAIMENPQEFIPEIIPPHDILLVVGVHEEIIISFLQKFSQSKGVIVPIERSNWISPYGIGRITEICKEKEMENSFPKPFCSFAPENGILQKFKMKFRIGRPEIRFSVTDEIITKADVLCSAPCGATYFSARALIRSHLSEDLAFIIAKQLSCYPCTADTAADPEFGDSIMHQAVKVQRTILENLQGGLFRKIKGK
jgi:hypothetical protein